MRAVPRLTPAASRRWPSGRNRPHRRPRPRTAPRRQSRDRHLRWAGSDQAGQQRGPHGPTCRRRSGWRAAAPWHRRPKSFACSCGMKDQVTASIMPRTGKRRDANARVRFCNVVSTLPLTVSCAGSGFGAILVDAVDCASPPRPDRPCPRCRPPERERTLPRVTLALGRKSQPLEDRRLSARGTSSPGQAPDFRQREGTRRGV